MNPQEQAVDIQAIQDAIERRKNGTLRPPVQDPMQQPAPTAPQQPAQPAQPVQAAPSMVQPQAAPSTGSGAVETQESNIIVKGLIDRLKKFTK